MVSLLLLDYYCCYHSRLYRVRRPAVALKITWVCVGNVSGGFQHLSTNPPLSSHRESPSFHWGIQRHTHSRTSTHTKVKKKRILCGAALQANESYLSSFPATSVLQYFSIGSKRERSLNRSGKGSRKTKCFYSRSATWSDSKVELPLSKDKAVSAFKFITIQIVFGIRSAVNTC